MVDAKDGNADFTDAQNKLNTHGGTFKGTTRTAKDAKVHKKNVPQGGIQITPNSLQKAKTNFSGKGS